jgi:vancomycin resistance protein YoaR
VVQEVVGPEQKASGGDAPPGGRRVLIPGGGPRWVLVTAAAAAAVAVWYVGAALALADRVPRGTSVAGIPVGGLGRQAALQRLSAALDASERPMPVRLVGRTQTLDPRAAGLRFEPRPVVDDLVGFSLDPRRMWRQAFGGPRLGPSPDGGRGLLSALRGLAARTDTPAVDATVQLTGTQPNLITATPGRALDVPASARVIRQGWLAAAAPSGGPLDLPVGVVAPRVEDDAVRGFIDAVLRPALAGPLLVRVGDREVRLTPSAFAGALGATTGPGGPRLRVDGETVRRLVIGADPSAQTVARSARLVLRGGRPQIIPEVDGQTIDPAALADAVRAALSGPAPPGGLPRTASVAVRHTAPAVTSQQLERLGVKERVSAFATNLTDNPLRTDNLRVAARTVNGTLVLPGETFSLNAVLGERTAAKGYHLAPAISGGRLVSDVGGGVSQMATTIFNNVFFSGLADVYHKPHSFFISRYPEGREATVDWPTVDLKWRNDSPYGVLVEAGVHGGQVHVSFWSTKVWDIKAAKGPRTNFRTPGTVFDPSPGCVAQAANGGFDVTVRRLFYRGGRLVRTETFSTSYIAEDHVICGPDPDAPPSGPGAR